MRDLLERWLQEKAPPKLRRHPGIEELKKLISIVDKIEPDIDTPRATKNKILKQLNSALVLLKNL